MVRIINLTGATAPAREIDVVVYRSGDRLVVSINVEGECAARVSVPIEPAPSAAKVTAQVAAEWPPARR